MYIRKQIEQGALCALNLPKRFAESYIHSSTAGARFHWEHDLEDSSGLGLQGPESRLTINGVGEEVTTCIRM